MSPQHWSLELEFFTGKRLIHHMAVGTDWLSCNFVDEKVGCIRHLANIFQGRIEYELKNKLFSSYSMRPRKIFALLHGPEEDTFISIASVSVNCLLDHIQPLKMIKNDKLNKFILLIGQLGPVIVLTSINIFAQCKIILKVDLL